MIAFARFKPRPLAIKPHYTPEDVTVVVPTTFGKPSEIVQCFKQILQCAPSQLLIVTANSKVDAVKAACKLEHLENFTVYGVPKLNKRLQMLEALKHIETAVTVFADDDVDFQHSGFLRHLLASFEDGTVGAAGPQQRTRRETNPSIWNFLGIAYLERRNFNTGATNHIDGGISTLSGRTQAILTHILKNETFFHYFVNDSFLGRKLMVDDDKCLTRYIYSCGWKIALNFDPLCTIETTQEDSIKYLDQCVRWARAHWRGNLIVMLKETYWYKVHWYTLYAIYFSQFQTPALAVDGFLFWLLYCVLNPYAAYRASSPYSHSTQLLAYISFTIWVIFTKIVKLIPHLCRYPQDIRFLPISIAFSYFHGIINIYALLTTHTTVWGSRILEHETKHTLQATTPLLLQAPVSAHVALKVSRSRLGLNKVID